MECLDENQVQALVQGRLRGERLARAQRHLDSCHECLDLVAVFSSSLDQTLPGASLMEDSAVDTLLGTRLRRPSRPPQLVEGSLVGRYEVQEAVGEGGMGVVYRAMDPELGREVALKVVRPFLLEQEAAERFEKRLRREARAMAQLTHPHVLTVYEVGSHEGLVFLATEWVPGDTLDVWMRERKRSLEEIVRVFIDAADGLCASHARGLIHRDFKPSNVMIGDDGRVRVFDFGLVRGIKGGTGEATTQLSGKYIVGTPAYMAPEQMQGHRAQEPADQFAFCVSLYEALTGARPFAGKSAVEILANVVAGEMRPAPELPRWLHSLLQRGLSLEPSERWSSMKEVRARLEAGLRNSGHGLWPAVLAGGALLLLLGGGGLLWALRDQPTPKCSHRTHELGTAWNEEVRAALANQSADWKVPYASATLATLDRRLEAYASEFRRVSTEICKLGVSDGAQESLFDGQRECLDARKSELSLARELVMRDGALRARAVDIIEAVPLPRSCRRGDFVRTDPAAHNRSKHDHEELLQSRVLLSAGKGPEAVALAESALSHSQQPSGVYGGLQLVVARVHQGDDLPTAMTAAVAAYEACEAVADHACRAHAAVLAYRLQRQTQGPSLAHWRTVAEFAVEEAGDPLALGHFKLERGQELAVTDPPAAEAFLRDALAILEVEFGPEHNEVLHALEALHRFLVEIPRLAAAEEIAGQLRMTLERTRGPGHPRTLQLGTGAVLPQPTP